MSRQRAWGLTGLASGALAVTLVDRQALAALADVVTSSLGISDVSYGVLSSGFAAAYLLGSLPSARLIQRIGPRFGLALTLALTSLIIALHALAPGFAVLLVLRVALGLVVAPSFACATQTVHRVLVFKDRARAIGILYLGNALGSSICPPLVVLLAAAYGWRGAFLGIALLGLALVPVWLLLGFTGRDRPTFDAPSFPTSGGIGLIGTFQPRPAGFLALARDPRVQRGSLIVIAAAPVTTVMLLWGTKYLVRDHGLDQHDVGYYLWLPPLCFGIGSLLFGELRTRSARSKARASRRPARALVASAGALCTLIALVPLGKTPTQCIAIAGIAMAGAGGLYSLATSDLLAHAARGTIPATTSFTTLTQSLVYIVVNPIIGKTVQHFGNFDWVMTAAGLWVIPGCVYWLAHSTLHPDPNSGTHPQLSREHG
jgi:predicted MFS family arabinose efflux permease